MLIVDTQIHLSDAGSPTNPPRSLRLARVEAGNARDAQGDA